MTGLREKIAEALTELSPTAIYGDGTIKIVAEPVADAVLRVLAEYGGVKNLQEQISFMVWRSANARAERAEADLAAVRQQLDQVRLLANEWRSDPANVMAGELLAILDASARPAGHDESGQ
jgi:hypothetical protein